MVNIFQSILFLLGSSALAIGGTIWGTYLPAFSRGSGRGCHAPGSMRTGPFFPISGFNFFIFFWPCSPPGTETTMIRRQRAPEVPPGPPVEDTHRTAGTTAVSKVGTEPSRFLSWRAVTWLGEQLLSFR